MDSTFEASENVLQIATMGMIIQKGIAWFVHCTLGILCKLDMCTGDTDIIGRIHGELAEGKRLYRGISQIDEKTLFFAPQWACEEMIYHIEDDIIEKREICGNKRTYGTNFLDTVKVGNIIWLIPTQYPALVAYDIITGKYSSYSDFMNGIKKEKTNYFSDYVCVGKEAIFFSCMASNLVIRFDLITKQALMYEVGNRNNQYSSIDYDGEKIWLIAGNRREIVIWNPDNQEELSVNGFPDDLNVSEEFLKIVCLKNFVYLFPRKYPYILKVIPQSKKVEKVVFFTDDERNCLREEGETSWPNNFYFVKKISMVEIIVMRAYDGKMVIYDEDMNERHYICPRVRNICSLMRFERKGDNFPYAIRESRLSSLDAFLGVNGATNFDVEEALRSYGECVSNIVKDVGWNVCAYMLEE